MITLWNVQFCANNIGVWDRMWYLTEKEAEAYYRAFVSEHGERNVDGLTGEYGDCYPPDRVRVEPTAEGLLQFANRYAVDSV